MKKMAALCFVLCIAFCLSVSGKLVCDEPLYDFGELEGSDVVKHVYRVRNEGDSDVRVKRVMVACGCTTATIEKDVINPGEVVDVMVSMVLEGRRGRLKKPVTIEYVMDEKHAELPLYIQGIVNADLEVKPEELFFGIIGIEEDTSRSVEIRSYGSKPVQILDIHSDNEAVLAQVFPVIEGERYSVLVNTVSPLPVGPLDARIGIRTTSERNPETAIYVSGYVTDDISVLPSRIEVASAYDPSTVRYLKVTSPNGEPFDILDVVSPLESIKTEVKKLGAYSYRVKITEIDEPARLKGKAIRILTTIPGLEVLSVPFDVIPVQGASGPSVVE